MSKCKKCDEEEEKKGRNVEGWLLWGISIGLSSVLFFGSRIAGFSKEGSILLFITVFFGSWIIFRQDVIMSITNEVNKK